MHRTRKTTRCYSGSEGTIRDRECVASSPRFELVMTVAGGGEVRWRGWVWRDFPYFDRPSKRLVSALSVEVVCFAQGVERSLR